MPDTLYIRALDYHERHDELHAEWHVEVVIKHR